MGWGMTIPVCIEYCYDLGKQVYMASQSFVLIVEIGDVYETCVTWVDLREEKGMAQWQSLKRLKVMNMLREWL